MSKVSLEIEKDEALVLFELLARFSEDDSLKVSDPAEERVLWNLHCYLEKQLTEPLDSNYSIRLKQARLNLNGDR